VFRYRFSACVQVAAVVLTSWQVGMVMAVVWILISELEAMIAEVTTVSWAKRATTAAGKPGESTANY
jgi:hypothetical protein